MRVCIAIPPLIKDGKTACLGQNRQFQWFSNASYFYPIVPSSAATLLKKNGFEVAFKDCTSENCSKNDFFNFLANSKPDLLAFEVKTPVVKSFWKLTEEIKQEFGNIKVVFFGDHATALPAESMINSKVDFIVTGGNYDFLLLNLTKHLDKNNPLEPGIYFREGKTVRTSGKFVLNHNLDSAPFIDRDLTHYGKYAYNNGNYKRKPGTYIMAARDCWWGRCTFCSWTTLYPGKSYQARSPQNVVNEIEMLNKKFGIREIMDDSGTFPRGQWLKDFCRLMIESGLNNRVVLNCNLRLGVLGADDYKLMKEAGFRLILCAVESANQNTLDRVNKHLKVPDVINSLALAKEAGLEPHLTAMVGYPWESELQAQNTVSFAKKLFADGLADTLQATIVIPYPGTPLFKYCQKKDLLKTLDWNDYDMSKPVIKSSISDDTLMSYTRDLYKSFLNPSYIFKKITSIKNLEDVKYMATAGSKVLGHLRDFRSKSV